MVDETTVHDGKHDSLTVQTEDGLGGARMLQGAERVPLKESERERLVSMLDELLSYDQNRLADVSGGYKAFDYEAEGLLVSGTVYRHFDSDFAITVKGRDGAEHVIITGEDNIRSVFDALDV